MDEASCGEGVGSSGLCAGRGVGGRACARPPRCAASTSYVVGQMTLSPRSFLGVRLSASGIKKPTLESCAGLFPRGWINLASSSAALVRTVARTVGTPGAKAIANNTNATAETLTAIFLNMMTRRSGNTSELIDFVKF
jgi:hypothetical protein